MYITCLTDTSNGTLKCGTSAQQHHTEACCKGSVAVCTTRPMSISAYAIAALLLMLRPLPGTGPQPNPFHSGCFYLLDSLLTDYGYSHTESAAGKDCFSLMLPPPAKLKRAAATTLLVAMPPGFDAQVGVRLPASWHALMSVPVPYIEEIALAVPVLTLQLV